MLKQIKQEKKEREREINYQILWVYRLLKKVENFEIQVNFFFNFLVLNLNSSVRKVKRLPSCLWLVCFLSEGAEPTERYSRSGQECNWVRIADLALLGLITWNN